MVAVGPWCWVDRSLTVSCLLTRMLVLVYTGQSCAQGSHRSREEDTGLPVQKILSFSSMHSICLRNREFQGGD